MGLLSGITDAVGLTDSGAAKEAMGKAAGLTREQMARLDATDLPDIEKQKILLENPELVGLLTAEEVGTSALEEISLDPQARAKQLEALAALQEYAEEGLTTTDKYAMEQMLGDVAAQQQSQQAGIEAQMARQGMDNSGAALMAKMQAGQQAANQGRQQAMQMASQGQQNRMNALNQLASQSGNMQSQDFARQSQVASARDAISQANAAVRQGTNIYNLDRRQADANQKAAIANQQQMYNKGLLQQQFNNQMTKAGAQNVASNNLASMYQNQAGAQAQADANTMGTIAGLGAAYIGGPMAAAAAKRVTAEDGGIMNKYACGGVPKAEDGNYYSDGSGEIIDSGMNSFAGDRVDAKVNDGEMVINLPQQQRMMDMIRGEIGVDELGNDDIIEGVPRDYRDSLHEKSETSSNKMEKRMRGLSALLESLGGDE